MGHHRAARRRTRRTAALRYVAAGVAVVLVGWLAVTLVNHFGDGDDCADQRVLVVNAAPDIAPAVTELARTQPCGSVEVRAQDSGAMLAALSLPDVDPEAAVWIPESTTLAERAGETRPGMAVQGTSVAGSPVVFAATEAVATTTGWPGERPDWADLVGIDGIAAGITDPTYDPVAAAALLGIQAAVPDPAPATAFLRDLSNRRVESTGDLFEHLPGGTAEPELSAFPTSEQRVLRHNSAHPKGTGASVVASYPGGQAPWLDYPYIVLPGVDPAERTGAGAFLRTLLGPPAADLLGREGLRTPDGRLAGTGQADDRVDAAALTPVPQPGRADSAGSLQRWAAADTSGHVLTVIDVSGSMSAEVPGTGRTRMRVTVEAARSGMRLFKPSTEFSLWEFSTKLDGEADHRQVAPWQAISRHLDGGLADDLGARLSGPKGETGLYDTTLAAYQEATRTWKPGRTNLVLILTDGRNEDENTISREELLGELGTLASPERPLPVIFVGLGTSVDPAELNDIAKATGGQVSLAPDSADIEKVFFDVLGRLRCPTGEC